MTDNRTTELLPCPWCGGESTVERIGKSGYYYVACNTAYCCDFGKFDTEAEAIAAWNTRAELGSGTCENSAKEWGEKNYYFVCSECGWNLANVGRASIELAAEMIKTCPNCGKRVSA